MSLASYIGCNVELPLSSEDSNDVLLIGNSFSEDYHRLNVKKYQFTTCFVYEVSTDWGIDISIHTNSEVNAESKKKIIRLCEIMDKFLKPGEYFEVYSCWLGEETEKRENELKIKDTNVDQIEITDKTYVRVVK
ncbi:hypothetical protein [Metabacillus endolithicus]|uniref:Uncharacterized protein n=1 Tax=Metabacillus endolithicus TaxID=1535204 RepID=A0ABW5BRP5_9BACI|nr:hypothetical protein [Metabacillus endolithicus]UPG63859.1 hypothetical protein MVE64_01465 [Metabacillus endolithicus]